MALNSKNQDVPNSFGTVRPLARFERGSVLKRIVERCVGQPENAVGLTEHVRRRIVGDRDIPSLSVALALPLPGLLLFRFRRRQQDKR